MCYEDLRQLYAATAKERDELKKELAYTKQLLEMARAERDGAVKTVEAGTLPDRRCVVSGRHENGVFYSDMTGEDLANILNAYESGMLVHVVHGRWLNNADDYPECNRCGYMPMYDPAIDDIAYSNYCPNCGARMDGE